MCVLSKSVLFASVFCPSVLYDVDWVTERAPIPYKLLLQNTFGWQLTQMDAVEPEVPDYFKKNCVRVWTCRVRTLGIRITAH